MKAATLLLIADSERDANMLYASRLFVPDPFIYVRHKGQSHLILSDLEMDRGARSCPDSKIHSLSALRNGAIKQGIKRPELAHIAAVLLRKLRVRKASVPSNFPLGSARTLEDALPSLKLSVETPFPERAIKEQHEVRKIQQILKVTQDGLAAGIDLIRKAKIQKNGFLVHRNQALTSEQVRAAIHTEISQNGGIACNTIVAGGNQACDPHERGSGKLKAHQPIIIDVFPRSETTGYFGDITRTVVRGKASEAIHEVYHAVGQAQRTGFNEIKEGASARSVHESVQARFEAQGFKTLRRNDHMEGFFHGTGHGLGLDIHEAPGIGSISEDTLRKGHVVTVEPGLYYPGLGGVRLEDVVVVQKGKPKKLTNYPHQLEV